MDTEKVGRRALIRRAATLAAAGIGGVAATEMLTASPASASTGAMQYGASQDAGASETVLTSAATNGATLVLGHTNGLTPLRLQDSGDSANFSDSGAKLLGGELVNLTETVDTNGGGTSTVDTLFWMAGDDQDGQLENLAVVLTTATGTVFAPVGPTRVLDTRTAAGRTLLATQTGILDSSKRLIGGKTLELQLDTFVSFAYAVHFNITAVSPTGSGFLTAFGSQTSGGAPARPNASNINFTTNVTIANHSVSPLTSGLSIYIYASRTTHVVVDVQGYTLPDFSFLMNSPAKAQLKAGRKNLGVVRRPMPRRTTGA